jgi:hypothetical protein
MTVIFVHGITVRRDRFGRLLSDVREGLENADCRHSVTGFYWGDLGRSDHYAGRTVPGAHSGRRGIRGDETAKEPAPGQGPEPPDLVAPLAELVRLRDPELNDTTGAGFRPLPHGVHERNEALRSAQSSIASDLAARSPEFTPVRTGLSAETLTSTISPVIEEATRADASLDAQQLVLPLARALTASLYWATATDDGLNEGFRWNVAESAVEEALEKQLGGQRGLPGRLMAHAVTTALRRGGRTRIMPGISLFMGDVLAWVKNKDEILRRLESAAHEASADGPLVLVGHSLGGVIAYEYCAHSGRDVRLLATVGSQVGFFAEMGVLGHEGPAAGAKVDTASGIEAWINVYDADDALSFLAEPMFSRVRDHELDTHAPFPAAHSEYWQMPGLYELLAGMLR